MSEIWTAENCVIRTARSVHLRMCDLGHKLKTLWWAGYVARMGVG